MFEVNVMENRGSTDHHWHHVYFPCWYRFGQFDRIQLCVMPQCVSFDMVSVARYIFCGNSTSEVFFFLILEGFSNYLFTIDSISNTKYMIKLQQKVYADISLTIQCC